MGVCPICTLKGVPSHGGGLQCFGMLCALIRFDSTAFDQDNATFSIIWGAILHVNLIISSKAKIKKRLLG